MKKIIFFSLIFIIMIGVSGCMNDNSISNKYSEEILTYLQQKYDDNFTISSMKRRIEADGPDAVLAQCHSKSYPNETFDVIYHLSMSDIYKKEEIIAILKEADAYDENKLKSWENDIEPYFEDNYANIVKQHQFDDCVALPEGVKMISRIKTPNYYPTAKNNAENLSEYFENEQYDVIVYNYVFVNQAVSSDEKMITDSIINKSVKNQYIHIIYTNLSIDNCVDLYYDNYDFPYEVFEKNEETISISDISVRHGKIN